MSLSGIMVQRHIAMRVIGIEMLSIFYGKYPSCKKWAECWLADMHGTVGPFLLLVQQRYPQLTFEGKKILIFKFQIDGVQYLMKVQVAEGAGVLLLKWVGPAVEYLSYMEEVNHGN